MIVAIHQPNFLPWLGYFHKLASVDAFVFLDGVQYSKNSFTNRNRIKTPGGSRWLTIPVRTSDRFGQSIAQTFASMDSDWKRKHLNTLTANYGRAPFFGEVFPLLTGNYASFEPSTNLADFNIKLIMDICSYLDLHPKVVRASKMAVDGASTDLLVKICGQLQATCYLAGKGAFKYQEDRQFISAGIDVKYAEYKMGSYRQLWGAFEPNLSVIDALMNCGRATRDLLGFSNSVPVKGELPGGGGVS